MSSAQYIGFKRKALLTDFQSDSRVRLVIPVNVGHEYFVR